MFRFVKKPDFNSFRRAIMKLSIAAGCCALVIYVTAAPLGRIASSKAGSGDGEKTAEILTSASSEKSCNWGLSFGDAGTVPIGNATPDYLAQFNSFFVDTRADDKNKDIYLTFDSGYENGYTAEILDVLKEEQVPAAFFLVGNYITENPELVKRMADEGHIVGNHTMHHPDMSAIIDEEAFKKEIGDLEREYENVTGKSMPKFYRPPQGKFCEANLHQAQRLGYTTVFWSLAYVDWLENEQPQREQALNTLNSRIHPGAIVLLHSTSKTNCKILSELIKGWKEKGYIFKSLTELPIETRH